MVYDFYCSTGGMLKTKLLDPHYEIKECWKLSSKNPYFIGLMRLTHCNCDGLEVDYYYKRKACKYT